MGVALSFATTAGLLVGCSAKPKDDLVMREQKLHPVTSEMKKEAEKLDSQTAPDFALADTSGKIHTMAELTQKKPLLIFFIEKQCPCCLGAKYFVERVQQLYPDHLNVVGVINGDEKVGKAWEKKTHPIFTVLLDPKLKTIADYKAERGVYITLVSPGGKISKAYPGYSLEMLKEVSARVATLAGVPAKEFHSEAAPTTLTSGCRFEELEPSQEKK
jgi:peroxiredoxin